MVARGAVYERQDRDFYRTPDWVTEALLSRVRFTPTVWEPACGDGAMVQVLERSGYRVLRSDIQPIADPEAVELDFLTGQKPWAAEADIITNPPYGFRGATAVAFIRRALELTRRSKGKVAMLLAADFDFAKTRLDLFDAPNFHLRIALTRRIVWFEGRPANGRRVSPAQNHAWFVWDWANDGRSRNAWA